MALFAHHVHLEHFQSTAFAKVHGPGDPTPYAGIYKCEACGHEIVSAVSNPLPGQTHPKHPADGVIAWRLIVYAQSHRA